MRHTTGLQTRFIPASALNPTRVWRPTAFAKGLAQPYGRIRFSTAPPCHDSATRHRYAIAGAIIERIGPYAGLLHRPAAHIGALEPRTSAPARRPSSECTAGIPHRSKKGGNGGGGATLTAGWEEKPRCPIRSLARPGVRFAHASACPEDSNAPNIDALRPRVFPHHWGNIAIIFRQVSVSYGKAGADSRWLVPSASGLRRAAQRLHEPHQIGLPRQVVLDEHALHVRADGAFLAARRRGHLGHVHAFGQ